MGIHFPPIQLHPTLSSKLFALILMLGILKPSAEAQNTDPVWLTNLEEAQSQAKKEGKLILLNFSGSDWCSNCKRLHKSFFESSEFKVYASKNLILLNLDFPAKKKNRLPKAQREYNDKLAEKYNKKGIFPQVFVLDAKGKILGNLKYPQKDPDTYINSLKNIKNK